MTDSALEIVLAVVVVAGGLFGLVGSWGMLRLADPMQRLHAPTKATTMGVGAALIASDLELWTVLHRFAWEEILIAVFLFITAPLSALMLAKVHLAGGRAGDAAGDAAGEVPPPLHGVWATQAADPALTDPAADPLKPQG